jgi:hypothetical protein
MTHVLRPSRGGCSKISEYDTVRAKILRRER